MWWLIGAIVVYLSGAAITAFVVAKGLLRHRQEKFRILEDEDYALSMRQGLGCGIIWPVLVPVALAADAFESSLRKSHEKSDPTLKKRRLEERERRVEQMERELGIK